MIFGINIIKTKTPAMHPVSHYIPQAPPMVMIGSLISSNPQKTTTSLIIGADNILVKSGKYSEAGLIENIAQTAALHAGYNKKPDDPVLIGFIGAVKNLKIYRLPDIGEELITDIEILHVVMGATIIKGISTCNNQPVAECKMKIFLKENDN